MIESSQNPEVKRVVKLRRARIRHKEGLFIVEGCREIQVGLRAGIAFEQVFFCRAFPGDDCLEEALTGLRERNIPLVETAQGPFEKISMRQNPDGLLALASTWETGLEDLILGERPLVLVIDGVEKPGNLGAVLRSAEAFGVDVVLCVDPNLDLFNPNVVRASQGLLFRVPVAVCQRDTAVSFLRSRGLRVYSTGAKAKQSIWKMNFRDPTAIVLGSEAWGLDSFWLEASDEQMTIPMRGEADSLNLSVAVGCLLAEVNRQRQSEQ
jgi:TrmH family RNA methyltransferase